MSRKLLGLPLLGILLSSLGGNGHPPTPPVIAPGNYASLIDYLQQHIPREMAEHRVPGLPIALVDGQELIWTLPLNEQTKLSPLLFMQYLGKEAGASPIVDRRMQRVRGTQLEYSF